jgi:hypothetical protein
MITYVDDGIPIQEKLKFGSPLHQQLLTYCVNRRKASEAAITDDKLESWGRVDDHWRLLMDTSNPVRRIDGSQDPTAAWPFEYGTVIPATYVGLQVRLTQELGMFTQRDPIWELRGTGPEDIHPGLIMEAALAHDMRHSKVIMVLWSLLQDAERYGIGIIRDSWEEEQGNVVQRPMLDFDQVVRMVGGKLADMARNTMPHLFEPRVNWGVTKEYCRWRTVDPRWFYTDPNYSVGENQRGKWNGHRDLISVEYMEQRSFEAGLGDYINIKEVKEAVSRRRAEGEKKEGLRSKKPPGDAYAFDDLNPNPAEVDHLELRIIPYRMGLGPSENEEIWVVEMVDDMVIVKTHPAPNWHQQYGYSVAEVQPDPHCFMNPGYAEHVEGMQWYIDWMVNLKFQYDKKRANNALFYFPEIIDEDTLLASNSPGHIKGTPWALRQMLSNRLNMTHTFRQLEMQDTTGGYLESAMFLFEQLNRELGSADPMSGVPLPTKRTLGEVSLVTQMASARIATVVELIDENCIEPAVNRSIANRQQFTSLNKWMRTTGGLINQLGVDPIMLRQYDLYGQFDYIKVDAKRPVDPNRTFETWMQFITMIGQYPDLLQVFNGPKIFGEALRVMGIRNYDAFLNQGPVAPRVVSDEEFSRMRASGQAAPMPEEGAA